MRRREEKRSEAKKLKGRWNFTLFFQVINVYSRKTEQGAYDIKIIIITVMTLALCAGFVTGARAGKKSTSDAFTHERLNRSAIESVQKSEKVIAGNVEWKILDVEEVGPVLRQRNTGAALETKGKFINIRLEVVNRGEEPKYIFDLRLVYHRGHTYPI